MDKLSPMEIYKIRYGLRSIAGLNEHDRNMLNWVDLQLTKPLDARVLARYGAAPVFIICAAKTGSAKKRKLLIRLLRQIVVQSCEYPQGLEASHYVLINSVLERRPESLPEMLDFLQALTEHAVARSQIVNLSNGIHLTLANIASCPVASAATNKALVVLTDLVSKADDVVYHRIAELGMFSRFVRIVRSSISSAFDEQRLSGFCLIDDLLEMYDECILTVFDLRQRAGMSRLRGQPDMWKLWFNLLSTLVDHKQVMVPTAHRGRDFFEALQLIIADDPDSVLTILTRLRDIAAKGGVIICSHIVNTNLVEIALRKLTLGGTIRPDSAEHRLLELILNVLRTLPTRFDRRHFKVNIVSALNHSGLEDFVDQQEAPVALKDLCGAIADEMCRLKPQWCKIKKTTA